MAEAFLHDIQTKPLYVAFFHGEFDTCPPMSEDIKRMFRGIPVNPATQTTLTVPDTVSIMQLTQPGEYLTLSSNVLYYLIHKKAFYKNTLMPLFAVDNPASLLEHPAVKHVSWNMEDRKGHSYENIVKATNKLKVEETAQAGLQLMKNSMSSKPYEAGDKTHFEHVLRFMSGDEIPNLKLSRFDDTMTGIGLYKYNPTDGRITRIPLSILHTPTGLEFGEDSLRLYHLLEHIRKMGGGRLMLFSCSSLAPSKLPHNANIAKAAIGSMAVLQDSYTARNPVCSPTRNWDLFVRTFPTIAMPNLTFENFLTLKAHDYKYVQWALYNVLVNAFFYKDMPKRNMAGTLRNAKLQEQARHGRYLQNLGNNLEGAPRVGENALGYGCRRAKEGCAIMGGKRRKTRRNTRRNTRKHN